MSNSLAIPAQALVSWARSSTSDPQARQLAVDAVNKMMQGGTYAGALLSQAFEANVAFGRDQNDAAKAHRAVLARRAYQARTSSELGRFLAAYSMLAEAAGNEAATIRQTANQTSNQSQRRVLIQKADVKQVQRNILIQAAQATQKALDTIPPLPDETGERAGFNAEVSVNIRNNWRPPGYIARSNVFFPQDARVAAGAAGGALAFKGFGGIGSDGVRRSLGGLADNVGGEGWWAPFFERVREGVQAVATNAAAEAQKVADQMPVTAEAVQKAGPLLTQLKGLQDSAIAGELTSVAGAETGMLSGKVLGLPVWGWLVGGLAAVWLVKN